jgi:hypothetical protein
MVRQRIFGILADYEDQNDHDPLRSDPIFVMLQPFSVTRPGKVGHQHPGKRSKYMESVASTAPRSS